MAPTPSNFLHAFPGFDCVVPQHAPPGLGHWWVRSDPAIGAQHNPLAVGSWIFIAEPDQQLLVAVDQPPFPTTFWRGLIGGAITIGHDGESA